MDLRDPGLMTDYELLSHVQTVHGPIPDLGHTPEHMTAGVMRIVRDMHDTEHQRTNHKHWHDYIILEDEVAEKMTGVYFREGEDGLDHRTNVWLARCGEPNCYFMISSYDEAKIRERYDSHECPYIGPTHYGVSVTISLIEECWQKADLLYDKLQSLGDSTTPEGDQLRYELRGMCKVLQVFVSPFFNDLKAVATEVAKRYNMHQAGTPYETPGTQTRVFEIPKQATEQEQVRERASKVLTDEEKKAIKFAADSGMFTVSQLASTYSVTEAVIREVSS